ncbi:MAG TPA: fumarylacetoacetate hydrolase family protein [Streptosporangiaceae bacterium]|jgi:2-polyprenyl-6-methoxyphenol hydroxylase-like FAD-dependent oxidoreductase/2-keto-4-pentenoate hydratase/2-oxohepta-3-ene-1,7-dioic acid hydratase in catechol pathway/regulator of RNase E activity RraA
MPPSLDADVIIIGAGPVGLTAAMDLDARGVSAIVVERRRFLEPPSVKCNHVSSRTMERFRALGVAPLIRGAGLPAGHPHDVSFRTTLTGREISRIPIPARRDRYTSATGPDTRWATPEPPHRINQTYLEPLLARHAAGLPRVTLLNETRHHRFAQTADAVEVTVSDLDGAHERVLRGRFLIGADGGRSAVRRQIGATLTGDPVIQHVQSTCIRAAGLYDLMPGERAWGYYALNPRRNGHVYSIDGAEVFLVHNHLSAAEAEDGSVDRDAAIRTILGVGADFPYEVLSEEDWVARRLVADRFRDGRVFIAGDAAHLWVPYAGYGMNAGIADALNLTAALGAYLGGWAGPRMLDAYEAERLPITAQVSRFAMSHAAKVVAARRAVPADIEDGGEAGRRAREEFGREVYDLNVQQFAAEGLNYGYVYDASPVISYDGETAPAYTMGAFTPSTVPGCRAPHLWLAPGVSLYDRLGPGYTLLRFDPAADIAALTGAAAAAGMPLEVVDVPPGTAPPEYRHALLVCRADQHVAWRGDRVPDDPAALVDLLRGAATGQAVPDRPGKIIAVHLNYPSRIAQRGRTPAHPSYFLKPSTSAAPSGGTVERPAGTELLAFEGEVALVIGATARNVTPEDAWSYVRGVTAANDLGVYDLRHADKGSNLRSKGGDGFTPLGPELIDAGAVDPAGLRVRTWVDGRLVQDDTTARLAFPFAQLIADLSQLSTLEPGDVVLTGTPAGSSVVGPGQRVEVEVDAPGAPGAPSSGRLVTFVAEGTVAPGRYGAGPKVDDHQRAEAWGSAEAAGLEPEWELTEELRARLASVATATLSSQLRKRGLDNVSIDGVHPTQPGAKLVGRARTLRFIPNREDLFAAHGGGFNAQKQAFDTLRPGDVLVVEARGERGTGTVGDILALRAKTLGAAGIVTDGGIRDLAAVTELGLPAYAAGGHPAVLGRRHVPWDTGLTIACGGAAVQPGDVIVGDDDGVLVIPPRLVEEVAAAAVEQEREEGYISARVAGGASVDGLYPMNAEWRKRYEAER